MSGPTNPCAKDPDARHAYPYGSWNPAALPHLTDNGILMAFQLAAPNSATAPLLTVRRLLPSPYWSMAKFAHQIRSQF